MTDGGFPLSRNFYVHMHLSFTHVNKTDNVWKVTCKCKWNMSVTRQSKTYKQLTFGVTVCFNGCQTSNVWQQNMSCQAPY